MLYRFEFSEIWWRFQLFWDIVDQPKLENFSSVLGVVVLLEVETISQAKFFSALLQFCLKDVQIHYFIHSLFFYLQLAYTICGHALPKNYSAATMFNCGRKVFFVESGTGFSSDGFSRPLMLKMQNFLSS